MHGSKHFRLIWLFESRVNAWSRRENENVDVVESSVEDDPHISCENGRRQNIFPPHQQLDRAI